MPQIETERLRLRGFAETDLDAYAEMCGDREVMRYIGGQPLSRAEAWRNMAMIVGHWFLLGYGLWAVEERSSGEMIGRIGCWQPEGWPGLEVGWTLRRAYWGRGYATEAAKASIDYGFKNLEPSQIISLIDPKNLASQRVAERLGAKIIKTTPLFDREVLVYAINRENWQL
ncbi:GNAT family N-acetyltransferase [Merismopedia glauca CCAP 1448/3]|uniref:GNAT family N-acetyltransferase n=1 Tax=Merismopedia glauca CCAP 1448/3 TaxID=1296344 RepID=A0A2T1C7M6_9CYAN|nr:GNAT family N-acetyltransferase [Merismopedia glauca CCAP 1448/3]